jgi:hypothetical protein
MMANVRKDRVHSHKSIIMSSYRKIHIAMVTINVLSVAVVNDLLN